MATAVRKTEQGLLNEDRGSVILGATLTVTTAALITMVTRLYVRMRMIHNVGWDDFVMISAMVLVCHPNLFANIAICVETGRKWITSAFPKILNSHSG